MSDGPSRGHGGRRAGAGRKPRYGAEPTRSVRLPASAVPHARKLAEARALWKAAGGVRAEPLGDVGSGPFPELTLFGAVVPAGPLAVADDHVQDQGDLFRLLGVHPEHLFLVRAHGRSMHGAGIADGDLLLIDRARRARPGDVVVASLDGEATVKRLRADEAGVWLMPDNPAYRPIPVHDLAELVIHGVVRHVVRALGRDGAVSGAGAADA